MTYSLVSLGGTDSSQEVQGRLQEALRMDFTEGAFGPTVHFLAFFLLGVSIAAAHEPWLQRRRFAWLGVIVLVASTVLELVQLLQPTRHPRVTDLVLNVLGLLVGLWGSTRWRTGRDWRLAVQEYVERRPLLLEASVLVLAIMWGWSAGLQPALRSLRMEWSKDFPLIIGNELDGSRPWLGEIRYAGVYGKALTGEEVMGLLNALEKGEEKNATDKMGLLAGYDFRRGRTEVIAPQGKLQSRDLLIEVPSECAWVANGGIELRKPAQLRTRGPAAELTEAILAAGAFSVEVWVRPLNMAQAGPARIISVSDSIAQRNFTLGQSARDFVFRVRNTFTGPNGSRHQLESHGTSDRQWFHLVAVYDHGVSTMYKNGRQLAEVVNPRDPGYYFPLGTTAAGSAALAALLAITIALPAFSLFSLCRKAWVTHFCAIALTLCMGGAPYVIAGLSAGGPSWHWNSLAWLSGALLVVYPLALLYTTSSHRISERSP